MFGWFLDLAGLCRLLISAGKLASGGGRVATVSFEFCTLCAQFLSFLKFDLQISVKRIQVELCCEKDMVKAMGSEWEPNVFIPADKMIRTLDSPSMQPFLREFNITAYGVKVKNCS